jgi:hypothetical protein
MPLIAYHAVRLARQALQIRRDQKAEDARGYTPEMAEAVMQAVQAKHDAVLVQHGVHAFVQRLAMPGKADGGPEDFRRCTLCGQWGSSPPRGVHREPTAAEKADAEAARKQFLADEVTKHSIHDYVTEHPRDSCCSRCGWSKYDTFIHNGAEAAAAAAEAEREQLRADALAKHGVHDYDEDIGNFVRCRVCGRDEDETFIHRGDAT